MFETFAQNWLWIMPASLGLVMLLERLMPSLPHRGPAGRAGTNLLLFLLWFLAVAMAHPPMEMLRQALGLDFRQSSLDWSLLPDLLALDLGLYLFHRWTHHSQTLWQLHVIHHLDQHMDSSTSVRFHPLEPMLGAWVQMPVALLLDIPVQHLLVFAAAVHLIALWHHANIRLSPRLDAALRLVLVTPQHHWTHHHDNRPDTDSNYGTVFTIWDRLFGTWSRNGWSETPSFGVEGEQLTGTGAMLIRPFVGRPEAPTLPLRLLRQLRALLGRLLGRRPEPMAADQVPAE